MTHGSAGPDAGRYRWYVLAILTLVQTCHGIDRAVIGLVLEPVRREFNFTDSQSGLLAGFAYGIAFAISVIPFGMAVDRFNRKYLMALALTFWSGATMLCGRAVGFWSMLAGRAAVGFGEAGGSPTGMSILADYFEKEKRATAVGIWYLSSGFGIAMTFFLGGQLVQEYGWRWAFYAAGLPGLLLAPVLLLTVREPRRGQFDTAPAVAPEGSWLQRVRLLFARPGIGFGILAVMVNTVGLYGNSVWIAPFLIRTHGLTIAEAGVVVALAFGVMGSIGGFGAGWAVDRMHRMMGHYNPARSVYFGSALAVLTACFGLAAVFTHNTGVAMVLVMLMGLVGASYNGPVQSVLVTVAGPKLRGSMVSFTQLGANFVGNGIGAWLIGWVSDKVGGHNSVGTGIGVAMLFCLGGGILFALCGRSIQRGMARGKLDI